LFLRKEWRRRQFIQSKPDYFSQVVILQKFHFGMDQVGMHRSFHAVRVTVLDAENNSS
jgi:hypothetical protein